VPEIAVPISSRASSGLRPAAGGCFAALAGVVPALDRGLHGGPQRPPGLIAHLAYRTEAGLRYVEVWQAKDDWEAFEPHRVHPVVRPLLQDMLGFVPPEPPKTTLDLVDAWTAEYTQAT
jgi:hypothetical protein